MGENVKEQSWEYFKEEETNEDEMEQQSLISLEEECFHRMALSSETSLSQWISLLSCCEG